MDQGSWIMDNGSRIQDPGSKDPGSWTLVVYESAFQKGYGRDIKTVQIYNPRSIILYKFYKDRALEFESWTLFWHERPF